MRAVARWPLRLTPANGERHYGSSPVRVDSIVRTHSVNGSPLRKSDRYFHRRFGSTAGGASRSAVAFREAQSPRFPNILRRLSGVCGAFARTGKRLARHGEPLASYGKQSARHGEQLARYGERLTKPPACSTSFRAGTRSKRSAPLPLVAGRHYVSASSASGASRSPDSHHALHPPLHRLRTPARFRTRARIRRGTR